MKNCFKSIDSIMSATRAFIIDALKNGDTMYTNK